ncbi:MAG: hypothetical protein M3Q29_00795 [Chloroflexota bacterium]|nr:hypothetical protein [Chloroflexota bacterium]
MSERPIPDSYWLEPGTLLAGEYPGSRDEAKARAKVQALLDAGVTLFIDLTDDGDRLKPYEHLLGGRARRVNLPIRDLNVPTPPKMRDILDSIDAALDAGDIVYFHCWGGVGRTGTVAGCYLVRHGMPGEEALQRIAELRRGTPDGWKRSPETPEQRRMVRDWHLHELPSWDYFIPSPSV